MGNVARNVASLGGQARIIAIVGEDEGAREVARLTTEDENLQADLITVPGRRTTLKTRYVASGQQLLRADQEDTFPLDDEAQRLLIDTFKAALPDIDVVVLSDYAKGCLSDTVLKETIEAGLKLKAVKATQLKRINVDTTVQEKAIAFPTDSKLYNRA